MKRALLTWLIALLAGAVRSQTVLPNEQWIQSLHGTTADMPLAVGQRLRVHDPEFNYHLANLTTYTQRYEQRTAEAVVQLRFDESRRDFYSQPWTCTVAYDLITHHIDGSVSVHPTQSITINYDPAQPYTDIAAQYTADVIWASLRVISVACDLTAGVPEDVWLDLRLDVDRHYDLGPSEAPQFSAWPALAPNDPSHLMLRWNFVEGADSYDLEWVFVDCVTINGQNAVSCSANGLAYDFANATRVNVVGHEYEIPLAYPRGWLVFRARAVGRETAFGAREEGPWNLGPQASPNVGTLPTFNRFQVTGLDNARNWTYEAGFAEQGQRKEVLSFFDGSLRPRQSMTLLSTDRLGLLDNKVYDALGRPSLSVLPYPVDDRVLGFKPNQLLVGSNDYYDWADFDLNTNLQAPDPLPGSTPAGHYYSSQNNGSLGFMGHLAPDAKDYPFTRTWFWNDGTGRVREEAGPGPDHTMGSGHTTKYAYGTPGSQYELDRLFGNEAGYVQHYKKSTVTDPNGVVSVSYQDSHGRTIATALAGFPEENDPLLPVDTYSPAGVEQVVLTPIPSANGPNLEWTAHRTILLSTPSTLTFNYSLDPASLDECPGPTPCKYDLRIRLLDDCGTEIDLDLDDSTTNIFTCIACTQVINETFTIPNAPAGTYTIEKVLKMNVQALDEAMQAFIDLPCIPMPEPIVVDCNPSCETTCTQTYTTEVDGVVYYTDEDGLPTTTTTDLGDGNYDANAVTTALAAIAACVELCGTPPSLDRCGMMHYLLVQDMKPGGQYFDNLPDAEESNYAINGWLIAEFGNNPGAPSLPFGTAYTDWDQVRANWDPAWEDAFVQLHPEWCMYEYYCNTVCEYQPVGGGPVVTENIPFYGDYYEHMYSPAREDQFDPTHPMFNPREYPVFNTPTWPYYQPAASTTEWTDALFMCWEKDCGPDINQALTQFLPRDPDNISAGYYSLWEVIVDPLDVAQANGGNGVNVHASVYALFNALHGENPNEGLIATSFQNMSDEQITPYEFFRGVYDFYRELFAYQTFMENDPDCPPYNNGCGPFLASPDNNGLTDLGFIIRYPRNPVFDNWEDMMDDPSLFLSTVVAGQQDDFCADACASAADAQMAQLQPCGSTLTSGCYDAQDADCIREALIAVCQLGCTDDQPGGSSLGDGIPGAPNAAACGETFETFQDVLDHYISGSATAIEHPVAEPGGDGETPTAECVCQGYQEFLDLQDPNASAQDIIDALEELRGEGETWTYNASQWQTWCADIGTYGSQISSPSTFPSFFACPVFSEEPYDCTDDASALANYNAQQLWWAQLLAAAQAYRTNLANTCMAGIDTRETFTMQYTLSEYHYTLYYYDQAGNLVKTVPPAGVNLNLASTYHYDGEASAHDYTTNNNAVVEFSAAVAAHRATPDDAGTPYIRPWHSMVTWYTYNSFQQPVAQHYPDGGTTRFFYDKLGRIIASQDAVQEGGGNYSYTLYDELGRPVEVGQLESPTALDQEIARGEGEAPIVTWMDFQGLITGKDQITRTYYTAPLQELDIDLTGVTGSFGAAGQQNLRNRVVGVTYLETPSSLNPPVDEYDQATHYSYDIHGNVKSLVQEIRELQELGQSFKRMDYRYDLISGKVLEVDYQHGQWDQWHHRYRYDADGRLLEARTSADGRIWERDARYFYYAHGPLARTELGDKSVQGTDHYYTLHGWLRGVNSPTMNQQNDPGKDGGNSTNWFFAEDAASYALGYYPNDYWPVEGTDFMLPANGTGSYATALADRALYNGNIPTMLTALRDLIGDALDLHANVYSYDRLNRLKEMNVYRGTAGSSLQSFATTDAYRNNFVYDPNGNISYQKRWGQNADLVDDLRYRHYQIANQPAPVDVYTSPDLENNPPDPLPFERTNRLHYVRDMAQPGTTEDQGPGNYEYDSNGRLSKDLQAGIGSVSAHGIEWTPFDKIRRVMRGSTDQDSPNLEFRYGPLGHRTAKEVRPRANGNLLNEDEWATTYYIHDAQGNPMAIYRRSYQLAQGTNTFRDRLQLDALPIYGNARMGLHARETDYHADFSHTGFVANHFGNRSYATMPTPWVEGVSVTRELGEKRYELTNHLGNVLSTFTDRRMQVPTSQAPIALSYYAAEVRSVSDYYPFGLLMPGRHGPGDLDGYRYAFQGQEHDDEINGVVGSSYAFEYRMHDSRIGRFLSIDPLATKYPWNSPYAFSENRVIDGGDLEGCEWESRVSWRDIEPTTGETYAKLWESESRRIYEGYLQNGTKDDCANHVFNGMIDFCAKYSLPFHVEGSRTGPVRLFDNDLMRFATVDELKVAVGMAYAASDLFNRSIFMREIPLEYLGAGDIMTYRFKWGQGYHAQTVTEANGSKLTAITGSDPPTIQKNQYEVASFPSSWWWDNTRADILYYAWDTDYLDRFKCYNSQEERNQAYSAIRARLALEYSDFFGMGDGTYNDLPLGIRRDVVFATQFELDTGVPYSGNYVYRRWDYVKNDYVGGYWKD